MIDLGLGAIISGGMNAIGSLGQGITNWFSQNENREMQVNLANTAYQRQMADLNKAGINPLMAGKLGGAQTPTLQAPQMTGIENAVQHITPSSIQSKTFGLQQQQMNLQQTDAETKKIEAEKDKAIADALLTKTTTEWYGPQAKMRINLGEAQTETQKSERLYIDAKTATENLMREPNLQKLQHEITSAGWKAQADAYMPTIAKANAEIEKQKAVWAKATSEAEAQRADAIAKMVANELTVSAATRDSELMKKQLELLLLQSKAGQELIATQLAKATYGANVAKPYIENILNLLRAGSIGKDIVSVPMKAPGSNIDPNMYKSWGW